MKTRISNMVKLQISNKEIRVSFSYCVEFKNKNNQKVKRNDCIMLVKEILDECKDELIL